MKTYMKSGFTLAEILITLALIGVVATMSIPSLMKNNNESANKAKAKKVFATFVNVHKQMMNDNGGTLKGFFPSGWGNNAYVDLVSKYFVINKKCYGAGLNVGQCWHNKDSWFDMQGNKFGWAANNWPGMVLTDGTLVILDEGFPNCDSSGYKCATYNFDVNGFKGPNKLGSDIFVFTFRTTFVAPVDVAPDIVNDCVSGGAGWACLNKVLSNTDY